MIPLLSSSSTLSSKFVLLRSSRGAKYFSSSSLIVGKTSRIISKTATKTNTNSTQIIQRLSSLAVVEDDRPNFANSTTTTTIIMDDTTANATTTNDNDNVVDIEDLHQHALNLGQKTYIDPATGFTVFTELCHLQRGFCCGNVCRHCPYGYENVNKNNKKKNYDNHDDDSVKQAKVKSGDMETTQQMVQDILKLSSTSGDNKSQSRSTANGSNKASSSSPTTNTTTSKNVPYTRKGDRGTSQLGTGERRSKDDANFEALGTIDELCSFVGVAHASLTSTINEDTSNKYDDLSDQLLDIMSRLFDIGSHVAKPNNNNNINIDDDTKATTTAEGKFQNKNGIGGGFDSCHIENLEDWINKMTQIMPELTSFILPSGSVTSAHLHVARTVCRRAERRCVTLVVDHQTCDPNALKYLNRLSDYFFTASRYVNYCDNEPEIQYIRNSPNSTQRQRVSRSLQQQEQEG